jgi:hypothetical protein
MLTYAGEGTGAGLRGEEGTATGRLRTAGAQTPRGADALSCGEFAVESRAADSAGAAGGMLMYAVENLRMLTYADKRAAEVC